MANVKSFPCRKLTEGNSRLECPQGRNSETVSHGAINGSLVSYLEEYHMRKGLQTQGYVLYLYMITRGTD